MALCSIVERGALGLWGGIDPVPTNRSQTSYRDQAPVVAMDVKRLWTAACCASSE